MKKIPSFSEDFSEIIYNLNITSRFPLTKNHIQHADISVYQHCIFVAYMSCKIATLLKLNVDKKSLIRGALLHDYFLYDWHDKEKEVKFHGFVHAKISFKNASEDFDLTEIEKDIILHHMFPLNITPPSSKEAWIICIADKICASLETLRIQSSKKLDSIYIG